MKYLMEQMKRREKEENLPVILMEIDYELMTLNDAMKEKDQEKIKQTKERLHELHEQLMKIINNKE